jgi:hypothetical protein
MKLTNNQIYTRATQLAENFQDSAQRLPIKLNFFIQKNKATLLALAQDIEQTRLDIIQSYGDYDAESGQFIISAEKIEEVTKELNDLFELEQEVMIQTIDADRFINDDNISLTTGQMEAIMFMIN